MRKLVLLSAFIVPFWLVAGGFQINLQGGKSSGMGGAFLGSTSLDASTAFFNPAGMTRLQNNNLHFGVSLITAQIAVQTEVNDNINPLPGTGTPFYFYYSGTILKEKLGDKLRVGMSINTPFGSGIAFDDNWQGRYITQRTSLTTFAFQPTAAYQIHKKISVGAGFIFGTGSFTLEKAVPVSSDQTQDGKASLAGSGSSVPYNIGLHSNIYSIGTDSTRKFEVNLGVNYRSNIKINLQNGVAKFTEIPTSLKNKFPEETTFTSGLRLPNVITLGVGVGYTKNEFSAQILYDFNYVGWSSYDTLKFDFANEETPDAISAKDWLNTTTHRFGLELSYKFISLRGGISIDKSPVQDGYVSPDSPDMDINTYSAGIGVKVTKNIQFDFYTSTQYGERNGYDYQSNFTSKLRRNIVVYGGSLSLNF